MKHNRKKISRVQLRNILNEEKKIMVYDNAELLSEQYQTAAKKILLKLGEELLIEMLTTKAGRKQLAAILTAIPNFIKKYICQVPADMFEERGGNPRLASAFKAICSFSITFNLIFGPAYALAYFLTFINDRQAQIIVDNAQEGRDRMERGDVDVDSGDDFDIDTDEDDLEQDFDIPSEDEDFDFDFDEDEESEFEQLSIPFEEDEDEDEDEEPRSFVSEHIGRRLRNLRQY